MRKFSILLATALATTVGLSACGADEDTIVVGASPVPHAKILEFVQDNLAEDAGINIEIKEFDDFVTPNTALDDGSIDANYFQHIPYLEESMAEHGFDFQHGDGIHLEPFAVFSDKHDSIDQVPDGGMIAITNDPSNQYRGLKLLEENGLLADIQPDTTVLSLTDAQNPKGLQFEETQPEVVVQLLSDPQVDAAIINGNFILSAGLNTEESIAVEAVEGNPYSNVLVWKTGSEKEEQITKLDELLHSPEVAQFIEEEWPAGDVLPGSFD